MISSSDTFDFDAFPATGVLSVVAPTPPIGLGSMDDWESNALPPSIAELRNPLTATFSDLDLAPARDILPSSLEEPDYWLE
jgi:hypothetical protein